MKPDYPPAENSTTLSADQLREKAAKIIKEMEAEEAIYGPGLRCPVCGGMLVHERLTGYRCFRGCQR